MDLPAEIRAAIEAHARFEYPNEACGLIASDSSDRPRMVYCLTNQDASPDAFTVAPDEHHGALRHAERHGWHISGSFHSHPEAPPVPSERDIAGALDPDWTYLIAGPVRPGPIELRTYRIQAGRVLQVVS